MHAIEVMGQTMKEQFIRKTQRMGVTFGNLTFFAAHHQSYTLLIPLPGHTYHLEFNLNLKPDRHSISIYHHERSHEGERERKRVRPVPSVGSFPARALPGGDLKDFRGDPNGALDSELVVLHTLHELVAHCVCFLL